MENGDPYGAKIGVPQEADLPAAPRLPLADCDFGAAHDPPLNAGNMGQRLLPTQVCGWRPFSRRHSRQDGTHPLPTPARQRCTLPNTEHTERDADRRTSPAHRHECPNKRWPIATPAPCRRTGGAEASGSPQKSRAAAVAKASAPARTRSRARTRRPLAVGHADICALRRARGADRAAGTARGLG